MNVLNNLLSVYGAISIIISVTFGVTLTYFQLKDEIKKNYSLIQETQKKSTENIEITQMMILKDIVRQAEHNPCTVSVLEWEEYIMNYSTLFNLKIKYGELSKKTPWQPIERLQKDSKKCSR